MSDLVQDAGSIRALSADIAAGRLTSVALVERCLARIAAVDDQVRAWVTVLAEQALADARLLDAEAQAGRLRGTLHGIPVGVKDVLDIAGLPTRAGCPARDGLPPAGADATVVSHLRAAGAVVLGKLHTTELAFYESVPPTRNPHDPARTPGGSSAGSGAAVAAGMVPLALGTQTAGSVNRPAAYCGVGAFKPSTLAIGGAGVVPLSPSFDTVGGFGASAADAALLVAGYAPAHLRLGAPQPPPARIVVVADPLFDRLMSPAMQAALSAVAERLTEAGLVVAEARAPVSLDTIAQAHRVVMLAEMARLHAGLDQRLLAPRLADAIAEGATIPPADYHAALHALAGHRARFWGAFAPDDLLLLPAAPDVAPVGIATGDPSFIVPFTALGGPLATVRASESGLPLGAMLGAAPGSDALLAGFLLDGPVAL
jgi:aspartyl-tRNA(Asn)/glutamyl-tRNA(Gln) amidotransferase subunit A